MAQERQTPAGLDLGTLLGGILAGGGGGASDGAVSADALSEGIGKVLSDPQMMAKLPGMIEMLRPLMDAPSSGGASPGEIMAVAEPREREEEKEGDGRSESPSAVAASASHRGGGGAHDRRIALLCALRPYLSPRRQEAIDYILRMDKMGKLFRNG